MIELRGLSPLQQELAERMWNMESMEDIVAWVQIMPRSVALQAYVVMQLILLESLEQEVLADMTLAQQVIKSIKK
jgi:hypothetical protein